MTTSATWKVGRLAEASGLTVRTLHHWDTIGLLSPSQRTTGGHREYTEEDLVRLYQVLALRSLGRSGDFVPALEKFLAPRSGPQCVAVRPLERRARVGLWIGLSG
ncbi:MerR family transcriptional regulator [Streptomyces sioyaensis]|uniref:MerR family transcriptional regulator n=1 Tax=Streptomyces sioyaensis TaxID=67364 RepID=UPI003794529A